MLRWKIKNGLLTFPEDRPLIMGILNVTPDSFSDGGAWSDAERAVRHAVHMTRNGADIIDIGGQSTRPGFTPVSAEEEWRRLEPVLKGLGMLDGLPPVSVDTFYPLVAGRAIEYGAAIINDVTGFDNADMRRVAARSGCGCVIMHHGDITGSDDAARDIRGFFRRRADECAAAGIEPEQLALDVGIGFGKTREQELELLKHCGECRIDGLPLLVGASRKRITAYMMDRPDSLPDERDEMTHIAHEMAYRSGADIIRVHDVTGAYRSFK